MLKNRKEAGVLLAKELESYKNKKDTLVLGIPRGGVEVAYEIAKELNLPLDIIVIKKIGAPDNEELAMGAVGVHNFLLNDDIVKVYGLEKKELDALIAEKQKEAKERYKFLGAKGYDLNGKTVILVDDGIATGATMQMAIDILKNEVAKIIVVIPVASSDIVNRLHKAGDEVICLETPENLMSIGEAYEEFLQVEDKEVKEMLKNANG